MAGPVVSVLYCYCNGADGADASSGDGMVFSGPGGGDVMLRKVVLWVLIFPLFMICAAVIALLAFGVPFIAAWCVFSLIGGGFWGWFLAVWIFMAGLTMEGMIVASEGSASGGPPDYPGLM